MISDPSLGMRCRYFLWEELRQRTRERMANTHLEWGMYRGRDHLSNHTFSVNHGG